VLRRWNVGEVIRVRELGGVASPGNPATPYCGDCRPDPHPAASLRLPRKLLPESWKALKIP